MESVVLMLSCVRSKLTVSSGTLDKSQLFRGDLLSTRKLLILHNDSTEDTADSAARLSVKLSVQETPPERPPRLTGAVCSLPTGPVDPHHPPRSRHPPHPLSPFRRLLPFGLDEFFDVPLERRSHRRRPSEFFVQMIPAFGATGDMLLDSEHFSLEEFLQGVALHHND